MPIHNCFAWTSPNMWVNTMFQFNGWECSIYLWRKVVCFVFMRPTKLGWFKLCSWCLWKALDKEGLMGVVPWCLDLQCKCFWILNDFFTKNEIKLLLKILEELECSFGVVGIARFNGIYLVRFGFKMWGILILN